MLANERGAAAAARPVPWNRVRIEDAFWSSYIDLVEKVVIPYQWDALNDRIEDAPPSRAIRNFRIAAGEEQGEFYGMVFQDSDVAKWLEAVAYMLAVRPNPELERIADETIDLIARAQQEDGYLNTYYTVKEPGRRWTNLCECHELYCAGHLIEAAVAYARATGKRKLLDVACRFADHIDSVFGPEEGKLKGYDGHQEIELALMKLYEVTGNERYRDLARFFLEERGREPHFYELEAERRGGTFHWPHSFMLDWKAYSQAHKPVKEQDQAVGHAVRFVYMAAGMAHVAAETGDADMLEACRRLFNSIVSRNLYITGAIGSQSYGESFTTDYDLPNDTAYAETCASIGLIFFAHRMLLIEPKRPYADVMEQALYNTVVGGMSRDGKRFFYVNPLEVDPRVCEANHSYAHVKPERQPWFGCACCPPNVARLLASLGQYIYTVRGDTVYTHLYIGGTAEIGLDGGRLVLRQETDYPWDGKIAITVESAPETEAGLALRLPGWCERAEIAVNGVSEDVRSLESDGYIRIRRRWQPGDRIDLTLAMPVSRVYGHPSVRHTAGKVALQRGPLVYCLEEADNGPELHRLSLPRDAEFTLAETGAPIEGMVAVKATALRRGSDGWGDALYRRNVTHAEEQVEATFIPYFAWANRGAGEMRVWVEEA